MAIHVATHGLMRISDITGQKYTTSHAPGLSIKDALRYTEDDLVQVDITNANTAGNPTIKAYLELEDAAGYLLKHFDQTYVITQK